MNLTIRVLGLTVLDINLTVTDQDDEVPGGVDSAVGTQAEPRFGFIPGAIEYEEGRP